MESVHQLMDFSYLAFQFLRRCRTLRFVILEHLMPEGRSGPIKGNSPVGGLKISKYFKQGTSKAIDGVYQFPSFGLG